MKKILLGTTAVVALATFSTQALAADKISLGLGGFQKFYAGKVNRAEADTVDARMDMAAWTNTEIYFTGSTTLDNGITVSSTVQLEADGTGTGNGASERIDDSYLSVGSDTMGTLSLGSVGDAFGSLAVSGPYMNDGGGYGDMAGIDGTMAALTAPEVNGSGDNTVKGRWVSASYSGVQLGLSYTPGEGLSGASNGKSVPHTMGEDGFTAAVAYSGDMGGASVDASLAYFADNGADLQTTAVGVSVGMNGFTVGGSYNDFSDSSTASVNNGRGYEVGIGYKTGAVSAAANYMKSNATGTAIAGDNQDKQVTLGVAYDLGAGVALSGTYYNATHDAEGAGSSNSSAIIGGIEIGF